ncbi:Zinc finger BED domain-containing protein-like protein [Leptotrombidium deliense]|uniref:Zinc finger BED domain-containing protein-like protein n=1 Tax=Leptotrombidium deliense TaxID=299467 RepID=A0A443RXR2_9ACAR|nr:Zinc finger BED domain-containing protein-like protein [Leptotrombidium deliense]
MATPSEQRAAFDFLRHLYSQVATDTSAPTSQSSVTSCSQFSMFSDFMDTTSASQERDNELDQYLQAVFTQTEMEMNVVDFWHKKQNEYPGLFKMFTWLFSVPASNVSSERNFNFANLTLTKRRARLDRDKVNEVLFVRANFDLFK